MYLSFYLSIFLSISLSVFIYLAIFLFIYWCIFLFMHAPARNLGSVMRPFLASTWGCAFRWSGSGAEKKLANSGNHIPSLCHFVFIRAHTRMLNCFYCWLPAYFHNSCMFPSIPSINPLKSARRDCTMNVKSTTGLLPAKNVQHAAGDWQGTYGKWLDTSEAESYKPSLPFFKWFLKFRFPTPFDFSSVRCWNHWHPKSDSSVSSGQWAKEFWSSCSCWAGRICYNWPGPAFRPVDCRTGSEAPRRRKKQRTGLKLGSLWVIWIPVRHIWY